MLEYKAYERGISVERVDERDTSKSCASCGTTDDGQRVERGLYVCEACGLVANADVNGAENIRQKVLPNLACDGGDRGDILPRLKSWASHARLRWVGNLRFRPDTPMGVPRPRYSYPVTDSELSDCFTSVEVSEGLLFDEANTESTASFRTVNHDGSPSQ